MDEIVTGVVEVTSQGRRTERRRIGQHLLDAVRLCYLGPRSVAEVETCLPAIEASQLLQFKDLTGGNAIAHIAEGRADANAAGTQPFIEDLEDLVPFFQVDLLRGPPVPGGAGLAGFRGINSCDAVEDQERANSWALAAP